VPYSFGYPLGKPKDPQLQHQIIAVALQLLTSKEELPMLLDFQNSVIKGVD